MLTPIGLLRMCRQRICTDTFCLNHYASRKRSPANTPTQAELWAAAANAAPITADPAGRQCSLAALQHSSVTQSLPDLLCRASTAAAHERPSQQRPPQLRVGRPTPQSTPGQDSKQPRVNRLQAQRRATTTDSQHTRVCANVSSLLHSQGGCVCAPARAPCAASDNTPSHGHAQPNHLPTSTVRCV